MSSRWMDVLVRARQAKQDAAQAALGSAQREAGVARGSADAADERVDRMVVENGEPEGSSAASFVAASAALHAAAATRSLALFAAAQADLAVDGRREALRDAAIDCGAAENLQERTVSAERAHADRLVQRDLDEAAARVHLQRAQQA